MNVDQKKLVEDHLYLVHCVMKELPLYNNSLVKLEYEDVFQEGCIGLIEAAKHYRENEAKFSTYASRVIKNRIINNYKAYCNCKQKDSLWVKLENNDLTVHMDKSMCEVEQYLERKLNLTKGVTKKGINAIAYRMKGYENKDIAKLYGVKSNVVSAWISKAQVVLKRDIEYWAA